MWTWLALPGIMAFVAMSILAWWLYRVHPRRSLNQRLALYVGITGASTLGFFGVRPLLESPSLAIAAAHTLYPFALAIPLATLLLLSELPGRWAQQLRAPAFTYSMVIYTTTVELLWFGNRDWFIDGASFANGWWQVNEPTIGLRLVNIPNAIMGLIALAVSWASVRESDGLARERARAFFAAFGLYNLIAVVYALMLLSYPGVSWFEETRLGVAVNFLVPTVGQLVFAMLLGIGCIRTQMVDLQSPTSRGVTRTLLTVTLAATVFAIAETFESFMPGYLTPLVGAAIVAAMFVPVQRGARALLHQVLPPLPEEELRRELLAESSRLDSELEMRRLQRKLGLSDMEVLHYRE